MWEGCSRRYAGVGPRWWLAVLLATLLLGGAAIPVTAGAQARQTYEAELTSRDPGSPTGLRQTIAYANPDDREGKPFAVEQILFRLPEGARIDTSVPPACTAADAQFQLEGADACSPETRVGTGGLSIDFGAAAGPIPRVVENDVTFFSNRGQLILFSESTNTPGPPVRNAARIEVEERSFVSRVPPLPGAPPPEPFAAVTDVLNVLDLVVTGSGPARRGYITTPPDCPPSGHWTLSATFTYRDGVAQTEESATPCAASRRRTRDSAPDEDGGKAPRDEGRSDSDRTDREGQLPERGRGGRSDQAPAADEEPIGTAQAGESLPFTGLATWAVGLLGMALTTVGLIARRASRRRACGADPRRAG